MLPVVTEARPCPTECMLGGLTVALQILIPKSPLCTRPGLGLWYQGGRGLLLWVVSTPLVCEVVTVATGL